MPKRKSDFHDENRKRVRRDTQQDISKLFKKRKSVRKPPEKISPSDEWFSALSLGKDEIDPSGIERLCHQLELAPDSLEVLVFAWRAGAKRMGYLTKEEWSNAQKHFNCDSPNKLRNDLKTFCRSIHFESQNAKLLHRFGFDFCREENRKILDKDTATVMLHCLMTTRWLLIGKFSDYFKNSTYRGMNRDQWNNVFEFAKTFGEFRDTSLYDPDGAWPVMIDEFVQYIINERKEGQMS